MIFLLQVQENDPFKFHGLLPKLVVVKASMSLSIYSKIPLIRTYYIQVSYNEYLIRSAASLTPGVLHNIS